MTETTSKRILVTGLSTYWGARLARELGRLLEPRLERLRESAT